jgi:F-type H+-transporting ATPase subunit delta
MKNVRSIKRYAQALYSTAVETNQLHELSNRLNSILVILKHVPEFRLLLLTKRITESDKLSIINTVLASVTTEFEREFLTILIENGDVTSFEDIVKRFHFVCDSESDKVKVSVTTASAISADDLNSIKEQIGSKLNKDIETETIVDSKILGGAKFRIGNTIVDGSVSTKLEKLRSSLTRT